MFSLAAMDQSYFPALVKGRLESLSNLHNGTTKLEHTNIIINDPIMSGPRIVLQDQHRSNFPRNFSFCIPLQGSITSGLITKHQFAQGDRDCSNIERFRSLQTYAPSKCLPYRIPQFKPSFIQFPSLSVIFCWPMARICLIRMLFHS